MKEHKKSREILKDFHDELVSKGEKVSFDQIQRICSSPFEYTRKSIEAGEFKTIRIMGFGLFYTSPKRVLSYLVNRYTAFKNANLEPKSYFETRDLVLSFLKKREDEAKSVNQED